MNKWWKLGLVGFILSITLVLAVNSASVQKIFGFAAHAGNNKWIKVSDVSAGDNLTEGALMTTLCVWTGTDCDRLLGTANGGLNVNIANSTIATVGDNTPTDDTSNPTDALFTASLLHGFDGTNWDRIRGNSTAGLDVNVVNASSIGGSSSNVTVLNAVTVTGAGISTTLSNPNCKHSWTVKTTGSPTTTTVLFEGSLDDTDFFTLDTTTLTSATFDARHVIDKCVKYVRGNLTALSGGTSPTVTVKVLSVN